MLNTKIKQSGFTIVELLIVIVVIAILAAISIVAYNGIQQRGSASAVAANINTVDKIAEAFNSDAGRYPGSLTEFQSGYTDTSITTASVKLPSSITIARPAVSTATTGTAPTAVSNATRSVTSTNGKYTVEVFIAGTTANSTGGVIVTWDYTAGTASAPAKYAYYGTATSASTFIQLGA
jgi:type IV pilus assembly protein PilA